MNCYGFSIGIENRGSSAITLGDRRVTATYCLQSQIVPTIIMVVGLILAIIGFVMFRRPSVAKPKAVPGGWEPTLQWGGGAGSAAPKKRPKMAIKSTDAPKKGKKKVVKKAAPAGGTQQPCKFCGKPVPASAFFCTHCYGKLR